MLPHTSAPWRGAKVASFQRHLYGDNYYHLLAVKILTCANLTALFFQSYFNLFYRFIYRDIMNTKT